MTLPTALSELDALRAGLEDYRFKLADALDILAELATENARVTRRLNTANADAEAARYLLDDMTRQRDALRRQVEHLVCELDTARLIGTPR